MNLHRLRRHADFLLAAAFLAAAVVSISRGDAWSIAAGVVIGVAAVVAFAQHWLEPRMSDHAFINWNYAVGALATIACGITLIGRLV